MSKNLVIVESPAKGDTIEKYLGKDFAVLASYGHVRDLIPKTGAIDTENGFTMHYEAIERNEKHVAKIAKALKKADALYLATDPDREGEAISWHLYEMLKEKGLLENKKVHRVVFHEITKKAVQDAVANPRELASDLVNAQQARRALDYLVGFNLSPLLWKKIRRGLSAGRVQSPALRMITERELEIEKFQSKEYWTIEADLSKEEHGFQAKLHRYENKKVEQFSFTNDAQSSEVQKTLDSHAGGKLTVSSVEKKQRKRNPTPPFITSTLQQEAARKLGLSARNTMRIAQQLYEGMDLGSGPVGLISYMRTDSVNLADEAIEEIRGLIAERYGKENVPDAPRVYKTKSKNAQEAHEAIRPTSALRVPKEIKSFLDEKQFKLYDLIWKRTVACQMIHATMDTVAVEFGCGEGNSFRATGSAIRHPGFMAVYLEGSDEKPAAGDKDERLLPIMEKGDVLDLNEIRAEQHFTEPPPRYSEASLIKTLEEYGIGRPSTYASIISTLLNREYVELEKKRFTPTDVGRLVNKFLTLHFTKYVDYDFTARLEDELDEISRGEKEWVPVMEEFWKPFKALVDDKETSVSRKDINPPRELGTDPKSGKPVSVRMGRYGAYAQIGMPEDEDKPKFAGLRPGQKMDAITYEEAMDLFKLPRELGLTPEGEEVSANIGRFGPYIRYDKKYVSLKEHDPYTVTLEEALAVVAEKKLADANRIIQDFTEAGIQVLNGRYGPYITDGNKNARIPKGDDPAALDLETCQRLIAEAPEKKSRRKAASKKKATPKKKATTKKKATAKKKVVKKKATKKKSVTKKKAVVKKKSAPKKKST
jgi:DNA topoisomerase-1